MHRYRIAMATGVLLACVGGAQLLLALTLDEAKSRGLLGEKPNGYVGVVNTADGETQALAKDINQKRRQAYEEIAKRNGTGITVVETLAGEKAIQNTKPGYYFEGPSGWVKK
jgi:uncharacterized protein